MTDRKSYFEAATSWATETRARESRSSRIAWTVAGIAAAAAMLEAVALALLMPLKTVQPVTLLVDRQTGFVQALDPQTPRRIEADEALTTSMLAQYVTAREEFDRATVSNDYHRVALWSTGPARAQYLSLMPVSNPDSPLQRYTGGTIVTTRVKSISHLSSNTALVRFDTQQQDRTGRTGISQPWIAVVRYRYIDGAMSFENRLVNPLGFQVTSYRRDAEAPASATSQVPPQTPAKPDAMVTPPSEAPHTILPRRISHVLPRSPTNSISPVDLANRGVAPEMIPMGSPLGPIAQAGAASTSAMLR